MNAPADPLAFREWVRDEAVRQNEMLRHTVRERLDHAHERMTAKASMYESGRVAAYRDVLALLGPDEAWTTDKEGNPF